MISYVLYSEWYGEADGYAAGEGMFCCGGKTGAGWAGITLRGAFMFIVPWITEIKLNKFISFFEPSRVLAKIWDCDAGVIFWRRSRTSTSELVECRFRFLAPFWMFFLELGKNYISVQLRARALCYVFLCSNVENWNCLVKFRKKKFMIIYTMGWVWRYYKFDRRSNSFWNITPEKFGFLTLTGYCIFLAFFWELHKIFIFELQLLQ